ncbi:MAG: hypothetical protein ABI876_13390, partial [Bacteroidota bacterium]
MPEQFGCAPIPDVISLNNLFREKNKISKTVTKLATVVNGEIIMRPTVHAMLEIELNIQTREIRIARRESRSHMNEDDNLELAVKLILLTIGAFLCMGLSTAYAQS